MKKPWFGAKAYGTGIGPKSREGWLSVFIYAVCMGAVAALGRHFEAASWMIGLGMLALTVGLLALMVVKGDHQPWRWRWGGR